MLVAQANELTGNVKLKMEAYSIAQSMRDALNAKIQAIKDLIAKGFSDPAIPTQAVYDNLLAAVNDLKSYADIVLAPTPEPTPSRTTRWMDGNPSWREGSRSWSG